MFGRALLCLFLIPLIYIIHAQTVQETGFALVEAWSRLINPTAVRFASDGRVFIIGKGGVIYTAKSVEDRDVKVAADISRDVFNNFDKGLIGIAPHPNFPRTPYVYVWYNRDGELGGPVPKYNDLCPSGVCFTSGALSRMTWDADEAELRDLHEVVVDWCSGSTTHAQGDLRFDNNNNLLFSVGDNTFFSNTLNFGEQPNTCPFGDPSDPQSGGVMQGQSPMGTSGKLLYISASDLEAWQPGQPAPQLREHARGFRNPYRFVIHPETNAVLLGDVGFGDWEKINLVPAVGTFMEPPNYGWPCYEGPMIQPQVQARKLTRCEDMYHNRSPYTRALFQYSHHEPKLGNAITKAGGASAVTGVGILTATNWPSEYRGAIAFVDYTRGGFWFALPNGNNSWDFENARMMVRNLEQVVDIIQGPDGAVYVSQIWEGKVWKFNLASAEKPVVKITPDTQGGVLPLTVKFSSAGSYDPLGGRLSYDWDLDGSGQFAGPHTPDVTFTYNRAGPIKVSLRVRSTSAGNPFNTGFVTVYPGFDLSGGIDISVQDWSFKINDPVTITANVRTETGEQVPESSLNWEVLISHCYPGPVCHPERVNCHQHQVNLYEGIRSATFPAPDHEYPSWLTIILRVTHPRMPGFTHKFERTAQPNFVNAQVTTDPPGLDVVLNVFRFPTPATLPTLQNGELGLEALTPQMLDRQGYEFVGWSQGGARFQVIRPVNGTVYTAIYRKFDIATSPKGQGPAAPINVIIAAGYRECTVSWTPSGNIDPSYPNTGFIVYHREVKQAEPIPLWSSGLVPATSTSYKIAVDTGSQCEFRVSTITTRGESSFISPTTGAMSLHLRPVGLDWCPQYDCKYRTVLVDNFDQGTNPRNMLGLLQEGEELGRFETQDGKLVFVANSSTAYWYSLMVPVGQCFDSTQFSHLSFKITAQPGWTLNIGMDSYDQDCINKLPKKNASVADYTVEKRFTGFEQTVLIPVNDISFNPINVQSIFFTTFTVGQSYLLDDLFFVKRLDSCDEDNDDEDNDDESECHSLTVERFTDPDKNSLGLWTGEEGVNRRFVNGIMYATGSDVNGYWATLIAAMTCRDLSKHSTLRFNIQANSPNAPPNTFPFIQIQQRTPDCKTRDIDFNVRIPITRYVKDGVASIPLSDFPDIVLERVHGIVLTNWPLDIEYAISNMEITCNSIPNLPPAPSPDTCSPLTLDGFHSYGANALGFWRDGEDVTISLSGDQMLVNAHTDNAYVASNLTEKSKCRDYSLYAELQFGLSVPNGASVPRLQLQQRNSACTARDPEVNAVIDLSDYIQNGLVSIPLHAFVGVDLKRAHSLELLGFTTNTNYTFSKMVFTCPK